MNRLAAFVGAMGRFSMAAVARTARVTSIAVAVVVIGACTASPSRPPEVMSAGGMLFPESAHLKKVEGYVRVEYDVTTDGTVANPRVVESVPPGVFDEAALAAVRSWKFHPAVHDGKIVESKGLVSRLDFKLGESEDYAR